MIKRPFTDLWAGLEELTRELATTLPAKRRMAGKDLVGPSDSCGHGRGAANCSCGSRDTATAGTKHEEGGREGSSYPSVRSSHPLSPMGGAQPAAGGQEP